ncbi:S-adenosyl-L-methionine-dependent methyltransferase [Circinella umbellata]|nr:S-adenosyl-L-methionine-dependent methyltransferase [Circinella umbellata]
MAADNNKEEIIEYKDKNRRYHEDTNAAYILPDDELENDRLNMQHYAIKLAFDGNYDAPVEEQLKQGITVLDGGCGPGPWTVDMAKAYPNSKFHGVDISDTFSNEIKPSNTEFQVHNITTPLPFPDDTFGFIHQRLLLMGLRKAEWQIVIENYLKVLQPGGWFEFTESTPELLNGGPNLTMLMGFMRDIANMKGIDPDVHKILGSYFKEAGADNVRSRQLMAPVNHTNESGALLWKDYKIMFTSMKPFVSKVHPDLANEEAYAKFVEETGEECKNYKTHFIFTRCYGQKPVN